MFKLSKCKTQHCTEVCTEMWQRTNMSSGVQSETTYDCERRNSVSSGVVTL